METTAGAGEPDVEESAMLQPKKEKKTPFVTAVLVAAGNSTRMGAGENKQFLPLCGKEAVCHTIAAFETCDVIDEIVLVCREEDRERFAGLIGQYGFRKVRAVTPGGSTRQQSVRAGISAASPEAAYFAVHDGARALIRPETIESVVRAAFSCSAAAAGVPVKDTIKVADPEGRILSTPDRSVLWAVQTPQVFERELYLGALARAEREGADYTDDCQLFEPTGTRVQLCMGAYDNIKLTTREDLPLAEALLGEKRRSVMTRIGHGYDVHRLVEGRPLILGGVTVPYAKGLLGHSDADVLTHAVMDALLGAAALGDIGAHFPDTDERYRGADSMELLRRVCALIAERGFHIGNIDATVLAQAPKLKPYISRMAEGLAAACGVEPSSVSVKATTEEGLGFTGAGEGIAAHAVCLLERG